MSEPDANGWMHIDSAPRDGTRVWLRLDTGGGPMEYIGKKNQDPSPRSGWDIEPNGYWVSVTHWQPLPAPPSTPPEGREQNT
jgi:hypothetical protein